MVNQVIASYPPPNIGMSQDEPIELTPVTHTISNKDILNVGLLLLSMVCFLAVKFCPFNLIPAVIFLLLPFYLHHKNQVSMETQPNHLVGLIRTNRQTLEEITKRLKKEKATLENLIPTHLDYKDRSKQEEFVDQLQLQTENLRKVINQYEEKLKAAQLPE